MRLPSCSSITLFANARLESRKRPEIPRKVIGFWELKVGNPSLVMIGFLVENVAFSFPVGFLMSFSIVALFLLWLGGFFVRLSPFLR